MANLISRSADSVQFEHRGIRVDLYSTGDAYSVIATWTLDDIFDITDSISVPANAQSLDIAMDRVIERIDCILDTLAAYLRRHSALPYDTDIICVGPTMGSELFNTSSIKAADWVIACGSGLVVSQLPPLRLAGDPSAPRTASARPLPIHRNGDDGAPEPFSEMEGPLAPPSIDVTG